MSSAYSNTLVVNAYQSVNLLMRIPLQGAGTSQQYKKEVWLQNLLSVPCQVSFSPMFRFFLSLRIS